MAENEEILTIKEDDYIGLAAKRKDDGDLVGSLTILLNLEESGATDAEIYAMIGEIYFDMEIYSLSREYWFRYLAAATSVKSKLRAYSALGATYCITMDNYLMGYYYDLEFSLKPQEEQEYDHVLMDYFDYAKNEFPEFYVTYPTEGLSSENLFVSAVDLAEKGDLKEALERFSLVRPDYEDFDEAVYRAAYCMRDLGNTDEEILDFLKKKFDEAKYKGKIALYILDFLKKDDASLVKFYLDEAAEGDSDEPSDWYFIARLYADIGCIDEALDALDKSLYYNPYEVRSLFLYGVLCYNDGDLKNASYYFKTGYDISRDTVNLFYYRLSNDPKCQSLYPRLKTSYSLPEREAAERITEVAFLVAGEKGRIKKYTPDELIALADFGLEFTNNLLDDMLKCLIKYAPLKVKNHVIDKLFAENIRNYVKMRIVEALVLSGYSKKLDVVFDGIYLKLKIYKATFDGESGDTFLKAYAKAVSKSFPFCKDLSKIRNGAYYVHALIENNGKLSEVTDENALAAAIVEKSDVGKFEAAAVYKLFSTTKDAVKRIKSLFAEEGK
ncbi:MAG: hypothetical protein J5762_01785 [Clostridia bacterium]|nr:hypothetical protein [Clostridia bacterium]